MGVAAPALEHGTWANAWHSEPAVQIKHGTKGTT